MFKNVNSKKLLIIALIITMILFAAISSASCALASRLIRASLEEQSETSVEQSQGQSSTQEESSSSEAPESSQAAPAEERPEERLVYLEVTSDPMSNHFEHRVLNIYAINPDGTEKELLFSDIDEKYDLGQVFSISPDNEKIACKFVEGGRGAYSALAVIDINSKKIKILEEYDYTDTEEYINIVDLYGEPVWTEDSQHLIYENIKDAHASNTRDVGIFKVNVQTGEKSEINLDVMGLSLRSTLFLAPVFTFDSGEKIACVFHPYYPVEESGEVIDFYTTNEGLSYVEISSGEVIEMFDKTSLQGLNGAPEIITSFDNFQYVSGMEKLVFEVLGDFEEDGDIWISDIYGESLKRVTFDTDLREQQPDCYGEDSQNPLIAYIGSNRYGTISNQIPSGDVYITDLSKEESIKLTDYGIGAFKPRFSGDGKKIGYLRAVYDDNFEYITGYNLESSDIESREVAIAASADYMDFIGWINK